mmetsp:Transcript_62284/g.131686  ORF Transcript_62284/g.131686 Transcript_62284/m.131686 type:complete len:204 (+) Transcript_62284:103-714(+)
MYDLHMARAIHIGTGGLGSDRLCGKRKCSMPFTARESSLASRNRSVRSPQVLSTVLPRFFASTASRAMRLPMSVKKMLMATMRATFPKVCPGPFTVVVVSVSVVSLEFAESSSKDLPDLPASTDLAEAGAACDSIRPLELDSEPSSHISSSLRGTKKSSIRSPSRDSRLLRQRSNVPTSRSPTAMRVLRGMWMIPVDIPAPAE